MEQNIKPILWVQTNCFSKEQMEIIHQNIKSITKDEYSIIVSGSDREEINLQVLSPYKDNGEIPEELLTWLKNQNDANGTGT